MANRKTFDPRSVPVAFWRGESVQTAVAGHEVGDLLRLYLEAFPGCTQTQLALLIEHDRSEISNWVRGVRTARVGDIDVLTRIADGLCMPDETRVLSGLAPAAVLMSSMRAQAHAVPGRDELDRPARAGEQGWRSWLRAFWGLAAAARVDIVCSELPEDERPYYADPRDRNYLRYAKFADLDSLIYLRARLTQVEPNILIRDFSPSEYFDTGVETLLVVGGPPWNAKYREFLPQLPYLFAPHPLGQDDPLVIPMLDGAMIGPRWSPVGELLGDIAVLTRLTLANGTRVFLFGGCLTLGVLGAAQCFLHGPRGAANATWLTEKVGDDDFVLVDEVRRVGGIADLIDLPGTPPLLLLARRKNSPFTAVVDNLSRYPASSGTRTPSQEGAA